MLVTNDTLDWESVGAFLYPPPTTEPLFPKLRYLSATGSAKIQIVHLLYMPFPSFISLVLSFSDENQDALHGSLKSVFKFSPKLRRLTINLPRPNITFVKFFSSYIRRWGDLHTVDCCRIPLDVDALAHLSHMPGLTQLSCTPSATLPASSSGLPLLFPNLHRLKLHSQFLHPISQLLSCIRLPVLTDLTTSIQDWPSKQCFTFFLASVRASVVGHTIQELRFEGGFGTEDAENIENPNAGRLVLGFEDLQPCTAFSKLRRLDLDFGWYVDLTDNELLTLAKAWPHLERLFINEEWGWGIAGGITPNGLLQLLQTCRSLNDIALTIDVRGFTEFREAPASLGLTLPPTFSINVLDSHIEETSVPAIAAFLAAIAPCPNFLFTACGVYMGRSDHGARWYDAYRRANDALSQRS